MKAGTESFRYFILGLLAQRPMSGYDIKGFLKGLGWLIGDPSFGVIYPTLHALFSDGLVTVEMVSRPDRPMRKIYTATRAGKRALWEWTSRLAASPDSLRSFVMGLILVEDVAGDKTAAYLKQRREAVTAHRSLLEQTVRALGEREHVGQRMAVDYGLATADAELAWLDSTLAQLSADPGLDRSGTVT